MAPSMTPAEASTKINVNFRNQTIFYAQHFLFLATQERKSVCFYERGESKFISVSGHDKAQA